MKSQSLVNVVAAVLLSAVLFSTAEPVGDHDVNAPGQGQRPWGLLTYDLEVRPQPNSVEQQRPKRESEEARPKRHMGGGMYPYGMGGMGGMYPGGMGGMHHGMGGMYPGMGGMHHGMNPNGMWGKYPYGMGGKFPHGMYYGGMGGMAGASASAYGGLGRR